jgi:hypothetical protein
VVLDVLRLGDLFVLGDVERAVMEGDAVRPVEAFVDRFLRLAVVGDRSDLVGLPVAHEQRALVGHAQRARVLDSAGIDLDLEARRQLELGGGQLVGRRR